MTGHNEFPTEVINAQSIKLGDGGNDDGQVLILFNMDRSWQLSQAGTGASTRLELKEAALNNKIFRIVGNDALGSIVDFQPGSATDANPAIKITDAKNDDQAFGIYIDRDANDAADAYAMKIVSDNAGAGKGAGIDMSSFSADEPLLKAPADAVSSAGTLSHQIAIDIGGTIFYLYAYTAGS